MSKTVQVRTAEGVRHLELSSGRVFDASGNQVQKFEPTENGLDEALADYAATAYYANVAAQVGHPVVMTDNSGNERLVKMDLGPADVHNDSPLSNYAAGYRLAEGVADIACPAIPTDKASNKYYTWSQLNAFKRVIPNGGTGGGQVPEINPTLSSSSFTTVEYALGAFVTTEVQANADAPLKPYQAAVQRVMNALLLEREIRVATMLQTSGNWDSSVVQTIASGSQWDGGASSDPVKDLHTAIELSQMPVSGIIMSERTAHAFQRNSNTQKYIAYKDSAKPLPNASQFAALLDLPPIYVAKMKYYASGTTMSYVWGNHVVLLHSPPQNPPTSQEDVATAYTFRWTGGSAPDGAMQGGFQVRTFFDPKRGGRGGTMVVVVHNDAEVMTSKLVGGLLLNAYQ